MIWYARLELGNEFIHIEMDAVDKEDALRLVDRQNKRLAVLNNRPEYHLVRLQPAEPIEIQKKKWRKRNG